MFYSFRKELIMPDPLFLYGTAHDKETAYNE